MPISKIPPIEKGEIRMAKQTNYTQLANEVIAAVGGRDNIISVTNCMTRLRFVLKDDSIPSEAAVKAVKGVQGVIKKGGQYQIIIGTHVNEVIKDVKRIARLSDSDSDTKKSLKVVKDDSLFNRFFKMISGCIMPMIGPMIAGGIIKGILVLLTTFGVLQSTDGTYLILYAASNALLYFLPIIVGFSAGKVFDCNPYVTATIGAALVYPELVSLVDGETALTFLGIPVTLMDYSQTLLPIIAASYFASLMEKLAKKFIPRMLQLMLVPVFVLMVTVPVSFLVIGPIMNWVSTILSSGVVAIFNFSPVIGGILFGAFWQVVVLLGLHSAFIPVLINNLFVLGSDPINAVLGLTVWALAGVSLGYALKMKDKEKRAMGFGNMASCLCGVTEPTIYSIALPDFKLFISAFIGGGVAGGILGGLGGRLYTMAGDGLFRIPGMINPEGPDISLYGFIISALIAFGISAVLAFFAVNQED